MNRTQRSPRRTALWLLHAVALVGCGWVICEIVADAEGKPAAPAPHAKPSPTVEPGEWLFDGVAENALPSPAVGTFPPTGAPRLAVRVADARVTAELYGPVNITDVVAAWRAAGWAVEESPAGALRYNLRRDGWAAVALPLPSKHGGGCQLLISAASAE